MTKLTGKQSVFIEEYLRCWNATEAARVAGYAHPNKDGPENLVKAGIADLIKARIAEKAMSADEVLIRLAEHARGSLEDVTTFVIERRPSRIQKPLGQIIADLTAEMLFEEECAAQAGIEGPEREQHNTHMASIERRILRYRLRLERDPDATDEVAGPMVDEQIAVVDLAAAKRRGKLHLVKSYNAKDNKVELYDAQAALGLLGKHHGLFTDKVEHSGKITMERAAQMTDEEVDAELKRRGIL